MNYNNNNNEPIGDDPLYYDGGDQQEGTIPQKIRETSEAIEEAYLVHAHRVFPEVMQQAATMMRQRLQSYTPAMGDNLAIYLQDVQEIVDFLIPEYMSPTALHYLSYEQQDWMIAHQPMAIDPLVKAYINVDAWLTPQGLMVMNARERLGGFLINQKSVLLASLD